LNAAVHGAADANVSRQQLHERGRSTFGRLAAVGQLDGDGDSAGPIRRARCLQGGLTETLWIALTGLRKRNDLVCQRRTQGGVKAGHGV
jgi:hypothetical protein